MTNAENIKLAIQAAWLVNEPAFALTLALREHALRGLCLQCAGQYRRLVQERDGRTSIWLICRQCRPTELRVHARRKSRWEPVPNSDELFEALGVEPEQIHQVMSSYATVIDTTPESETR